MCVFLVGKHGGQESVLTAPRVFFCELQAPLYLQSQKALAELQQLPENFPQ